MRQSAGAAVAALAATSSAKSLADICTVSNVQSALSAITGLNGIVPVSTSVTAAPVYNVTSTTSTTAYSYCNVTLSYQHPGLDSVAVVYALPDPATYTNRFYVGGGYGYTLNADATLGLAYGAAGGATDAGYGALAGATLDEVVLNGNGSLNLQNIQMFAYKGLGEMTQLGKAFIPAVYGTTNGTKQYTYYEGCSDGGREGQSQIQRYAAEYDGAITGAPAFRHGQQQVNHMFSNVAEVMADYYPPPCELEKIMNMTIAACDGLDGRVDGVISRSDLCQATFDYNTTIGQSYYCAATTTTSLGFGFSKRQTTASSYPEQNGTVTAQAAALASQLTTGMFNSKGERVYLPWQIGTEFTDAATTYNTDTSEYEVDISSLGGVFITKFLQEVDLDNLSSLDGVTMDTLQEWMTEGMVKFMDTLQTTLPDLTPFKENGGKLIHYHGEADPSIPTSSSVRYYHSVADIMYPGEFNTSVSSLQEWYKLFIIPGAAHCGSNDFQPGPWPSTNMATLIEWVEGGVAPETLNATVVAGSQYVGEVQGLCAYPLRPMWTDNSTMVCEEPTVAAAASWTYDLDAFLVPVY